MPSTKVGVERKVHTDLVPSDILDIAPLQADESSLGTSLREGVSQPRGDDTVCFGRGCFYSHWTKYMGRKGIVDQSLSRNIAFLAFRLVAFLRQIFFLLHRCLSFEPRVLISFYRVNPSLSL